MSKQQYTFSETTFDVVKKLVQAYKTGDLQKILDAEKSDLSREEFDTLLSISSSIGIPNHLTTVYCAIRIRGRC